ncbi:MAG: LVIVD repeat-containing protein [Gemmatimonadales bacterium]
MIRGGFVVRTLTGFSLTILLGAPARLPAQHIATVELAPAHAAVTAGDTIRFRVTARDSSGQVVAAASAVWFATPFDIAAADPTGLVTTTRPGQTYVFALVGGKPGFAVLDIAERTPARLEIATPDGRRDLVTGEVVRLYARGFTAVGDPLGDGGGQGVVGAQWHSLGASVAEVSPTGIVRAKAVGRTTIVASLGPLTARYEVRVRANPVSTLRVLPVAPVRAGDVVTLRAEARGADGRPVSGVQARWSVTGRGAEVSADGRFVAALPRAYAVTATVGNRVAHGEVQVLPRRDPRRVDLVSHVSLPKDVQAGEIWPVGNVAYVSTIGNAVYVFDIADPTAPKMVDSLTIDARLVNDVMTTADGAVLVVSREGASSRRNGLMFFDTSDPRHPRLVSEFTETVTGGVHSAFVYQRYVFATDDATGSLRIIDFSDVRAPKQVARWEVQREVPAEPYAVEFLNIIPQRYLHDVYVENGLAYLAYWRDGLVILDVGNGIKGGSITNPKFVSQYSYNHADLYPPGFIAGTHAVVRSGNYVFLGDESYPGTADLFSREQFATRGLMHVVDVSDLAHPRGVAFYDPLEFGVHNIAVRDGLAYIGAYDGGIRVVDVSGELRGDLRAQGRVIGSLYTGSLEGYRPNMALAWSAMPHNGYVFTSDINSGLWVARVAGGVVP